MRSYLNCPSCGRFINLEQVEASCQLCDADMCTRCMHECQECGKEVCRDCWGGGNMCSQCNRINGVYSGIDKLGSSSRLDKTVGVVESTYNAVKYLSDRGKLKEQSSRRAGERQEAMRRIAAQQRKQIEGD